MWKTTVLESILEFSACFTFFADKVGSHARADSARWNHPRAGHSQSLPGRDRTQTGLARKPSLGGTYDLQQTFDRGALVEGAGRREHNNLVRLIGRGYGDGGHGSGDVAKGPDAELDLSYKWKKRRAVERADTAAQDAAATAGTKRTADH